MEFDQATKDAIKHRMEELNKDPQFMKKIDKETRNLRGRNLRRYISKEAIKKSEHEVRN